MNSEQLLMLLDEQGVEIDGHHQGVEKFRDVYVGCGLPVERLVALQGVLKTRNVRSILTSVTNPEHEDHGKPMLELPSFWWDAI